MNIVPATTAAIRVFWPWSNYRNQQLECETERNVETCNFQHDVGLAIAWWSGRSVCLRREVESQPRRSPCSRSAVNMT